MKLEEIKKIIKKYLVDNYIYDADIKFQDSDSLTKNGYIDSIGTIEFVDFLSKRFNIEIQEKYLTPEYLDNIESASNLIAKLKNEKN